MHPKKSMHQHYMCSSYFFYQSHSFSGCCLKIKCNGYVQQPFRITYIPFNNVHWFGRWPCIFLVVHVSLIPPIHCYQIDESLLTIFCLINICACLSLSDEANKIIGELLFKKNPNLMYKLEMGLGFAAQKFCSFWLQLFISFIIDCKEPRNLLKLLK